MSYKRSFKVLIPSIDLPSHSVHHNFFVHMLWLRQDKLSVHFHFQKFCILPLLYKKSWLVTINLSGKAGEYIKKAKQTIGNLEMIGRTGIWCNIVYSIRNCALKTSYSPDLKNVTRTAGTKVYTILVLGESLAEYMQFLLHFGLVCVQIPNFLLLPV